jgi:ABC-2 type transport system permease protein
VRTALAALRFQLGLALREPDNFHVFATAPLSTLIFLAIIEHSGRADLIPYGLLAPVLMALWTTALFVAGEMISEERERGILEALVIAPAPFVSVVMGRLCAVAIVSLGCVVESVLVAGLVFRHWLTVHQPLLFAATLVVTVLAMAGTATVLSAAFVLTPSARTFQNTLSYPFFLLAGVLVPLSLLPEWIQPLGRLIFLSWSADLLRDSLSPAGAAAPVPRLAVVALLGLAGLAGGTALLNRFLRKARAKGTLAHL